MIEHQYDFKRGNVGYTLTVTREEQGHRGRYFCHACNVTIEVNRWYASEREASARLQAVAYAEHHAPVHIIG